MSAIIPNHKSQHGHAERDDDPEPGLMPVDPDQGVLSPNIPLDSEHDRMVDPEA